MSCLVFWCFLEPNYAECSLTFKTETQCIKYKSDSRQLFGECEMRIKCDSQYKPKLQPKAK